MVTRPFLLVLNSILTANGTGSLSYQAGNGEQMQIQNFNFIATGAFSIVGIRDSDGTPLSNCSASNPILSTMVQNSANANRSIDRFLEKLLIDSGKFIIIDLLDTSGAGNTVRFLFEGLRTTPN